MQIAKGKIITLVQIRFLEELLIRHSRTGGNPECSQESLDSCFRRNDDG